MPTTTTKTITTTIATPITITIAIQIMTTIMTRTTSTDSYSSPHGRVLTHPLACRLSHDGLFPGRQNPTLSSPPITEDDHRRGVDNDDDDNDCSDRSTNASTNDRI
eukprot:4224033-Pyramimonas_sp.AAC.1